ncbi:helix-turn-helix domain-containing protein [Actinomadura flavalba]|uniref:helix-turn-helix domain-containing protein n=1 Tax=Actinomadura flavalba TaxID=1120938 RepID=UPI00037EA960|nr:AraC family transcriptional regulator [Actinomadura flavalba]
MERSAAAAIQRAIDDIHQNIGEAITIDDLARTAMFSKFHFSRLFRQVTGVSPGRFLSAVRLEEAKRLLLTTSMSVTEITYRVGYNSVGTFSTRFKNSVGMSPTTYRERRGFAPRITDHGPVRGGHAAIVQGEVVPSHDEEPGTVFLGLFPDTIPQGVPARCTVLERAGRFRLDRVPQGTWFLLAQSVPHGEERVIGDAPPTVAAHGPLTVRGDMILSNVELRLRSMRSIDPPVLLALLDARRIALQRMEVRTPQEETA